jgi:hypothetical protein
MAGKSMSEMPDGKRRLDQVLSANFTEGLGSLDDEELRRRRDLARLEREYLSFLRRLLQGRRDILRDELDRRRTGGKAQPVVERVVSVLSEGSLGPARGEAPVAPLPEEELALARRRVERLLSDAHLSDLEALPDPELESAIGRLDEEERSVSEARSKVIDVHDALQGEVKRRLRAELGNAAS